MKTEISVAEWKHYRRAMQQRANALRRGEAVDADPVIIEGQVVRPKITLFTSASGNARRAARLVVSHDKN